MTTTQKVIKYIAIAFAIFLIVTIISGILTGSYKLLNVLGLIHTDNGIVTENLNVISNETKELSSLNIDLSFTNLNIKSGDTFKVETNNSRITFEENNGSVKIKEENQSWLNNNIKSNLIVYIPKDIVQINDTNIKMGAGNINIEELNTKGLYLELGAGDTYIENAMVTEKSKIDGGIGNTELKSCEINNLEANLGMGEFRFWGKLTGKNKIDSGIGAINMKFKNNKNDYKFEVNKGIGNVTLDEQKNVTDGIYGSGEIYLSLDGGVGEIKIEFEK